MTLAELVVVLAILAVVGGLVLPAASQYLGDARDSITRSGLARLREAIAGNYWQDCNGQLPRPNLNVSPSRFNAPQIRYLFVNPATEDATVTFDPFYKLGWRGPYVVEHTEQAYTVHSATNFTDQYGANGDPTVCDGWGHAIVIQNPGLLPDGRQDVRLVSAGPDGILQTPPGVVTASLTTAQTGDDVILAFGVR